MPDSAGFNHATARFRRLYGNTKEPADKTACGPHHDVSSVFSRSPRPLRRQPAPRTCAPARGPRTPTWSTSGRGRAAYSATPTWSTAASTRAAGSCDHPLSRAVRIRQTTLRAWDLLLNNCNSFAADIAAAIGLRTPPTIEFPDDFVRDLFVMNRAPRATRRRMHASRPRRPVHRMVYERDALFRYDSDTRRILVWR
ncbi:MAG: hypothetical protein P8Z80_12215 [Pseudolabrys sp.]